MRARGHACFPEETTPKVDWLSAAAPAGRGRTIARSIHLYMNINWTYRFIYFKPFTSLFFKRGVVAARAADVRLVGPVAHFTKRARSTATNVELLQQLPPMFIWFVLGCMLPSWPDPTPALVGTAHEGQRNVLMFPPYDRQRSMPKYMPVM